MTVRQAGLTARARDVYLATRKRHDQLFNVYFMRPLAAAVVVLLAPTRVTPNQVTLASVALFVAATGLLVGLPGWVGGVLAVLVIELSYLLDCADGMLARHRGTASKSGHLFDFFTDELKALLLAGGVAVHLWRSGGYGPWLAHWPAGFDGFLLGGIAAVVIIASATSLTNFVRRPEISGVETPVEAHYEAHGDAPATSASSPLRRLVALSLTLLRFLGHYPSHLWLFAALGRLDAFLWIYAAINLLYLGRGWLGLALRFGRPETSP